MSSSEQRSKCTALPPHNLVRRPFFVCAHVRSAAVEVPVEPSLASRGHYSTQARKAAVQRFLAKKRRRLANQTKNGPRYTKMKAVADGKQRNSSGKFVKRPILEAADYAMLNPAPVKVETAISLQAAPGAGLPQIFAVTIAAPDESELVA
eukprot:TRINITY_DN506_c0_g1_i6.p1 TRINITY_DN506_c0_g1~~TRINITY_DN506_c0_g1_i6.p1  ORF type:complete len:150 (+),score=34.13 TRINITY_DN506_c0_g1_i6:540-989(+)